MTKEDDQFVFHEDYHSGWWKRPVVWMTLFAAACLVCEITAKPVLGVLLLCSKFGWDDIQTAYRLRQIDSNRPRGRAFFWFLLATALMKVGAAGSYLSILLSVVFIAFKVQQRPAPFPQEILVGFVVLYAGMFFAFLAVLLGFWNAFRAGLRIWLTYPPFWPRIGKENVAEELLAGAISLLGFISFELIAFAGVIFDPGGNHLWISCVLLASIAVIGAVFLKLFFALRRRLIAQHPIECWDDDFIGTVMLSQLPNWRKWRMLTRMQRMLRPG